MATRDIGNLGAWPKRFFDDPRLLVLAPPAPPLRPDQDLASHLSPALKYVLKDVLYCPGTSSDRLQDGQTFRIYEGPETSLTFVLLPRRWVVERTLAWLNQNRRLAKDFEATIESAETWLMIASVKLLTRRLART